MKFLFLFTLFLHTGPVSLFKNSQYPAVDLMQVRLAPWPINLQRVIYLTDTCYALQFRDQHAMNAFTIRTLDLENIEQLKYFREGLTTLKKGHNGDIAEFSNYSIKRFDKKKNDTWYILSYDDAVTNFQEAQVNRMIFIVNTFINSQH
jgi:hypothetical protein